MKEIATELELLAEELDEIAEFDEECQFSELGDWFMSCGSSDISHIAYKLRNLSKGIK